MRKKDGDGYIYRVDWPEYHVSCAECGVPCCISPLGVCNSKREAEKRLNQRKTEDESEGWEKIGGKWHCDKCVISKGV